ncbi:MAG: response regulator [Desulfobacterium sp.]|nr:response regulator [Desulfobacterium sp.]
MPEKTVNVLVLDDEESIRHSIAAYFEDEGFTVFEAASGEDALELLESRRVDAAIVDIRLPGMDGNTFMTKACKIDSTIRFVVHTGSADYVLPDSLKSAGVRVEAVFIKPVHDLNVLITALKPL